MHLLTATKQFPIPVTRLGENNDIHCTYYYFTLHIISTESRNLQLKEESSCDRIDLHASFLESSSCTDSDVTPVNTVNNSFLLDELQ